VATNSQTTITAQARTDDVRAATWVALATFTLSEIVGRFTRAGYLVTHQPS